MQPGTTGRAGSTGHAPPVDTRTHADLIAQLEQLAQELSPWRRPPDGRPDAGQALIRVGARFAELVVDRLNRVPEKNFLAFLDLIGTTPQPPRPARVPVTFGISAGADVPVVVPAGSRVGGPPLPGATGEPGTTDQAATTGDAEEVVFETERELVCTAATLVAAFASDTETDTFADRTAPATGLADAPFGAFGGDTGMQTTPHELHLACDPALFAAGTPREVAVSLSPAGARWATVPLSWAYWDGVDWRPAAAAGAVTPAGAWAVTVSAVLPQPRAVGGITGHWLRCRPEMPLPPGETGLLPEAIAVGARNPQDFAPPFEDQLPETRPIEPFDGTVKRFYLSADDAFSAGGSLARLRIRLARPGVAPGALRLTWSYQAGDSWQQLGQSGPGTTGTSAGFADETIALTRDGTVTLPVPPTWPRTLYRTRVGRWLRVDVTGDAGYTTTPAVSALSVDVGWDLPRVERITIGAPGAPVPPQACVTVNDFTPVDRTAAARGSGFTPFTPTADTEPALYLGFDRPFEPRPMTLYLQVEPPLPEEVAADRLADRDPTTLPVLAWEYAGPAGWLPLGALDGTAGLTVRGEVRFPGPADQTARRCFGREAYWVRMRWRRGAFAVPPRLRRVLTNTAWARHLSSVDAEILGSSTGHAGQTLRTAQTPVQPGHQLVVREPELPTLAEERALAEVEGDDAVSVTRDAGGLPDEVWVRWHAVPDLHGSGPRDRHYTLDALAGRIRFGDGTAGLVPPPGQNNLRIRYRAGGGAQGNRPPGTVVELRSAIPYVDGVTNHEPAEGGAAAEPIALLTARGPRVLRHRDRAVVAADLEDLAAAASPDVARAAAIVPSFNPSTLWLGPGDPPKPVHDVAGAGRVGVVVVPTGDDPRPTPGLGLLRTVRDHLTERLPASAELWVAGPEWIAVDVTVTVAPGTPDDADAVASRVRAALARYLHPVRGGPDGTGWPFAGRPRPSMLIALVEAVEGVDHVRSLTVALRPQTTDVDRTTALRALLDRPLRQLAGQTPPDPELLRWLHRALVHSGTHTVDLVFD